MTRKVGKEGCYAAEVMNRFINFGVINLYYVPFWEVTAAESRKKAILLSLAGRPAKPARLHTFTRHIFNTSFALIQWALFRCIFFIMFISV